MAKTLTVLCNTLASDLNRGKTDNFVEDIKVNRVALDNEESAVDFKMDPQAPVGQGPADPADIYWEAELFDKDNNSRKNTGHGGQIGFIKLSTEAGAAGPGAIDIPDVILHEIVDAAKYATGRMVITTFGTLNTARARVTTENNGFTAYQANNIKHKGQVILDCSFTVTE